MQTNQATHSSADLQHYLNIQRWWCENRCPLMPITHTRTHSYSCV